MLPAAIGTIALALIIFLWLRFRPTQLECKEPLFNPEFRAFLGQLDIAVRSHLIIFPAMPVKSVILGKGGGKALLRKFKNESFDFVVCHRRDMDVLCVIKLGGSSTSNEKYRKLCQSAGLTLLEYDIKPYRDVPSLRKEVLGACGIDEFELPEVQPQEPEQEPDADSSPDCPKCQSSMVLKTINKGSHAGEDCWVCSQYPDCKGARLKK
ncbi:topoisomerase-associated Zn-finger domain protein [Endozoicomonas montiporae CL-33]|nr:topoisomerase-associated Zn-finger domain protein [Endozoicomonas montiporae CL-33]